MLSPRLNLGQPKAISVAPVGRKAFAAIWLLSSTIASLPAPATTCTGVQLGQGNWQLCGCGCLQATFTETHKWLQWRWRSGFNTQWSALKTGKSQVTSLLTVLEEQRVAFSVVLGGFSQKGHSTGVTGSVAGMEWCSLMFSVVSFVWNYSATTHPELCSWMASSASQT